MTPLRFVIYLPDGPSPAWVSRLLGLCAAADELRLVGVMRSRQAMPRPDIAERIDGLLFDRGASLFRPLALEGTEGLPVWRQADPTAPQAQAWLADLRCDVLLDFRPGADGLCGGPSHQWTLELDGVPALHPQAGARQVVGGLDTTTIRLRALRSGETLDASLGAACSFSIRRNRLRAIAKGIGMVRRALLRLARGGNPATPRAPLPCPPAAPHASAARRLGAMLHHTARRALGKALSRDQWGIALAFGDDVCRDPAQTRLILPPADRFWADPMVWPAADQGWWVFIEEVIYAEGRGTLKAIRVHPDGRWEQPVPVMARPWHLSYPFLFWWEGALWMVPESGANRTVELYRCINMPDRWEKAVDLLTDIDMVDATVFAHGGRWWLLGNVSEPGADKHDELHAFHAPSPLGPWEPHAANPVVADARAARPAGSLFRHGGRLLRPAQVCVPEYGHALVLRRIERLTPTEYVEATETRIDPGWLPGIACVHTLSHEAGLTAFDFLIRRSRLLPPAAELRRAALPEA